MPGLSRLRPQERYGAVCSALRWPPTGSFSGRLRASVTSYARRCGGGQAARPSHKLLPFREDQREAVETVRGQSWDFSQTLKADQPAPGLQQPAQLAAPFADLCTAQTCFQSLPLALKRLRQNKGELLLGRARPEVPVPHKGSERALRDAGKKRKRRASTRGEDGRKARDPFLSLQKTCRQLGLSFWPYLQERLTHAHTIPPLPPLLRSAAQVP